MGVAKTLYIQMLHDQAAKQKRKNISMDTEPNYCPRCIEDYSDSDGEKVEGTKTLGDCDKCGVCKECEHMLDCDNRPALKPSQERHVMVERTKTKNSKLRVPSP